MLTKAEIVEGLFTLSVDERLEVRDLLNDELDGVESGDDSLSLEWRAEITRRLDEYHRGEVEAIPWEDVKARLETQLAELRAQSEHAR